MTGNDVLIHDAHTNDPGIQLMLAKMAPPKFPMAMGVIRSVRHNTFDENMERIIAETKASSDIKNVDDLLKSGNTWEI